ncbi:MAG TPA: glycosyltransferase family 2 protein [Candidatus Acidoferrales bacterium]|nr:glycosyltransferase family 2 protein [Candidatus Acidoferrales bacterium]
MNRLTVTLITRDEEKNLPRALASLSNLADEIVVVDSGSTDRTCELARQHGARVLERPWTNYSDQKNFAAAQATYDWVLNLDADEELSPGLQTSLRRWKEDTPTAVAYHMRRKARYLGRWIHHSGWYPDPKLRLYRRDRAHFIHELHEKLQVEGLVGWLEGDLHHYTVDTFGEHIRSVRRYTTLAAAQLFAAGRRRWLLPMLFASPWAFLRTFFLQQGFRDGYRGFLIALMAAYYVFLKYRKLGVLVRGGSLESGPGRARS